MKIAIAGPDGAGKTAVCDMLAQKIRGARVVYAGKNRGHMLFTTTLGLRLWEKSRKKGKVGYVLSLAARYLLFYPLEYVENLKRFGMRGDKERCLVYDRHPIDRVILRHEFRIAGKQRRVRYLPEYILRNLWGAAYLDFFPGVDMLFVLLPPPELCFERSGGQYGTLKDARDKIEAYVLALESFVKRGRRAVGLHAGFETTLEQICSEIMEKSGYAQDTGTNTQGVFRTGG